MAENITFIGYDEGDIGTGRDKMKSGFEGYFSAYPAYRIPIEKVTRSGKDIAIVGKTTGSHISPEIETKETVIWIAKIEDNQVAEWRIFSDMDHIT